MKPNTKHKLLIVDDEPKILRSLTFLLEEHFEVFTSDNSKDALAIFKKEAILLMLLDLRLNDESGLHLMNQCLAHQPKACIIMMTAYSTLENSINAIKAGAYYFIPKPINNDQLLLLLNTATEKLDMFRKIDHLEGHLKKELIGSSLCIQKITDMIDKVKDTDATILITGESGTGKELIAHQIHRSSNRSAYPYVAINCAAMPGELLESELFGYRKGAFTGAQKDERGIIRRAHKGTLLLDEIGEMDLRLQSKLLRFLQDKEVRHIGDAQTHPVDVRIICITNRDLTREVERGTFREDLYYRINVINLVSPPLRERPEDLPHLTAHFIDKYNIAYNKHVKGFSDEAFDLLRKNPFKGNVRELENIVQRAVLLNTGEFIEPHVLHIGQPREALAASTVADIHLTIYEGETMKEIERKVIAFALKNNDGNRKWTADSLGISERALRYKIKEYHL